MSQEIEPEEIEQEPPEIFDPKELAEIHTAFLFAPGEEERQRLMADLLLGLYRMQDRPRAEKLAYAYIAAQENLVRMTNLETLEEESGQLAESQAFLRSYFEDLQEPLRPYGFCFDPEELVALETQTFFLRAQGKHCLLEERQGEAKTYASFAQEFYELLQANLIKKYKRLYRLPALGGESKLGPKLEMDCIWEMAGEWERCALEWRDRPEEELRTQIKTALISMYGAIERGFRRAQELSV